MGCHIMKRSLTLTTVIWLNAFFHVDGLHCLALPKDEIQQEKCLKNSTYCAREKCPSGDISCYVYATVQRADNVLLQKFGCFSSQKHPDCTDDKCILHKPRAVQKSKKDDYFCCCFGEMCDVNFVVDENFRKPLPRANTTHRTTTESKGGSLLSDNMKYIVTPVIVIVFVGVVISIYLIKFHGRIKLPKEPLLPGVQQPPLELETRAIQVLEVIHQGRISCVYKAAYKDDVVAVKMLYNENKPVWDTERDMYEKHNLNHENILKFIGAERRSLCDRVQYWIITEYHSNGSLVDYLQNHTINVTELLTFLLGVVRGLNYLHMGDLISNRPIIAHRDLKTRNIMVKTDLTCCIGDFGLAIALTDISCSDDGTAQVGTVRYMAPEILQGAITFQLQSYLSIDVYALALVMWEVLSRCETADITPAAYKAPYIDEIGYQPTLKDMSTCVVTEKRRPRIKDEWKTNYKMEEICLTIEDCWDDDPDARVTASCVKERLNRLLKDSAHSTYRASKTSIINDGTILEFTESTGLSSTKDYTC